MQHYMRPQRNNILLIIFFATCNLTFCQNNSYKLAEKINITYNDLIKVKEAVYGNHKLISLNFTRKNDSISYITKIYNTDSDQERFNKIPSEIKTSIFDEFVQKLNQLDIEKPEIDFNIADGITYSLSFGDGKHTISLSANSVDENERNNFLDVFYFIWKKFEE